MLRDDLDTYKEYSLRLSILEAAKLAADDVGTLGEIENKIKILEEDRSELALRMFKEGQL